MRFNIPVNVLWVAGCGPRQLSVCLSGTRHITRFLHQHFYSPVAHASCGSFSERRVPLLTECSLTQARHSLPKRCYAVSTASDSEDGMMSDSEFDGNVFFRRKLLEKDQLDSLRVNLYPGSSDPVIKKINEANSMQEVFDQIEGSREPPTAEQISQAIVTLWDLQKVYGKYGFECSMITKCEINQFLEKILNHPSFEKIVSCLETVCGDLNNNALSSMMLYLSKLGVRNDSAIQQKLSLLCLERISDFNLTALSRLSVYLREQGIRGYFLQSRLLPMIARKLDDDLDADEFLMITICLSSSKRLVTKSLIEKYIALIEKRIDEGFFKTCDPRVTLKAIKLLTFPEWPPVRRHVRHLMQCLEENFHALSAMQVLDLSIYFQSYLEPSGIFHKIRQYSVNSMEEAKITGGRPDILCMAPFTPLKSKRFFEVLIAEQLEQKDLYEYIMVIFKALRHIKTSNTKLCDAFWMKSMTSVEEELQSRPYRLGLQEMARRKVYQRYMYFNNNLGGTYRNYALEKALTHLLLEDLKTCMGHLPNKVANMASFIISYSSSEGIPEDVYEKVLLCGPQFSIFDTLILSRGIQISLALNRKNVQRKLMQQITTICRVLDARTEEFLKSASSLIDVTNLTRAYLNRKGSPRTFTFDRIMAAYPPLLHELNARHIRDICLSFNNTLYLAPDILEAVSQYVVSNQEFLLADTMDLVLMCFYSLGYTPPHVDQLLAACSNAFLEERHNLKGLSVLQMCLAMNMYGHLPSEVIQSVFNLKFMDQLDEEIKKCYSKATYPMRVRHLLMELNRAVCLDHPEANIPWFHEKYCEEFLETVAVPMSVFHTEVYQALTQLIGGPDVLRANVHTAYYYLLDFEFVLDGNSKPMAVKDYTDSTPGRLRGKNKVDIQNNPGHKRVGVVLRRENHYCTNQRQLLGRHQVECRHLELLGYTVVEVPHFLWYSMAHATYEDKVQYLREQIFPIR